MAKKWKKSPVSWVWFVLEVLFIGVLPAALIIANYASWGDDANGFKVGITGILLLLVVAFVLKKLVFNKRLEAMRAKLNQHEADLEVETDEEKIENLVSAVRKGRTVETVLNFVVPFLVLVAVYLMAKALEDAAVLLSGTLGFVIVSVLVGFMLQLIEALTMRGGVRK